jgi:hypothetical protein
MWLAFLATSGNKIGKERNSNKRPKPGERINFYIRKIPLLLYCIFNMKKQFSLFAYTRRIRTFSLIQDEEFLCDTLFHSDCVYTRKATSQKLLVELCH